MLNNKQIILYRILELMISKEQSTVLLDELYEDELIGQFIKNIQIDSPFQEMVFSGAISQFILKNELVITFTVEAYFHHALSEYIGSTSKYFSTDELSNLLLFNKLKGIDSAISNLLTKDILNNRYDRLVFFIDKDKKHLEVSVKALSLSFLLNPPDLIIQKLLEVPSINDWLAIKKSYDLLIESGKSDALGSLNNYILNTIILDDFIKNQQIKSNEELAATIETIKIFSILNALDRAKFCFELIIKKIEEAPVNKYLDDLLCDVLEAYAESEYGRSGQDGYKRSMDANKRSLALRLLNPNTSNLTFGKLYLNIGLSYLSLGLQVKESKENLELSLQNYLKIFPKTDPKCLHVEKILGIVYFWWGLRANGRWGHIMPELLDGINYDPFVKAALHFESVYDQFSKAYGKHHEKTIEACHYLQEVHYILGNYDKAIPWLKKIQTDNFYKYSLIVSLEEQGILKQEKGEIDTAFELFNEALFYANTYYKGANEICNRINQRINNTIRVVGPFTTIDNLLPLVTLEHFEINWSKLDVGYEWVGWETNQNLVDYTNQVIYLYNQKLQLIKKLNPINNLYEEFSAADWPSKASQLVIDVKGNRIIAWPSIKDDVYAFDFSSKKWILLFSGVHDVTACGAAFGWDAVNSAPFQFGGYGYFKYKNWYWEFNEISKDWVKSIDNFPGISPFPRNTQVISIHNTNKALFFSGIGSDTGLQREHKARGGLASATDVGYFTWLRDVWEYNFETKEYKLILSPNHETIQHEGAFGINLLNNLIFNWSGIIPSIQFGIENKVVEALSIMDMSKMEEGFKNCNFSGERPPLTGVKMIDIPGQSKIMLVHQEGVWIGKIKSI
jgi:tetratricopeptide (TPR) repeat protein